MVEALWWPRAGGLQESRLKLSLMRIDFLSGIGRLLPSSQFRRRPYDNQNILL